MTAANRRASLHRLRLAAVEPLTADSVALTFEVPPPLRPAYRFTAGQHVSVASPLTGDEVRRTYSICSPACDGDPAAFRVGVKRIPGGAFSGQALDRLGVGDEVEVMTPTGTFGAPLSGGGRWYAGLVAGSGVTPVLSLAATALADQAESRFTVVCANRTAASVMFLEDLADLKDRFPDRFDVVHVLSQERRGVPLLDGRLDADRLGAVLAAAFPASAHLDVEAWFLCGPLPFMTLCATGLSAAGVDPRRVHREVFHVDEAPAGSDSDSGAGTVAGPGPGPATPAAGSGCRAGGSQVRFRLDGRSATVQVDPAGPPVLDAVLAERADAPYACRNGVCGTCRARCLEGSVRMDRDWALEPDELAEGYVLTCQSHPASPVVVLDYDA